MFKDFDIAQDIIEQWKYAIESARSDKPRYLSWIRGEVEKALSLINSYDKVYVLGWFGTRLIQAQPNFYSQFMNERGEKLDPNTGEELYKPDPEIEVLCEYAINLASSSENENVGIIPSEQNLQEIHDQLHNILFNLLFYELAGEDSSKQSEFDYWLRKTMVNSTLGVRGDGFSIHILEVYKELFASFDDFLIQYYGFSSKDIFDIVIKLENLVVSKTATQFGAIKSHERFKQWSANKQGKIVTETMIKTGKHFIEQFLEDNPDLGEPNLKDKICAIMFSDVKNYSRMFWVIPATEAEKKIFELLSLQFGDNKSFLLPPHVKGLPLNDTLIRNKPLIKFQDKYFCFSINLPYRCIFSITENLLASSDKIFYETNYLNNVNEESRDNFIEKKVRTVFEKMLPGVLFYPSVKYFSTQEQVNPDELDILGISDHAIYIIEVKAGQLNVKHKRGDLKGLKQRLNDIISVSAFQCHRAMMFIKNTEPSIFTYVADNTRKNLTINAASSKHIYKISVSFEHLAALSANLSHLINGGFLSQDYKYTWSVSLFDLMVFSDLITSETDFIDYLNFRLGLYDRDDIEFFDELDLLEMFFDGNASLPEKVENKELIIQDNRKDINDYFNKVSMGYPGGKKPFRKKT